MHAGGTDAKLDSEAGRFADQKLGNAFCGDRDRIAEDSQCIDILKKDAFMDEFEKLCVGKKSCQFNMVKNDFFVSQD